MILFITTAVKTSNPTKKSRLSLAQGLVEKNDSGVPHPAHGRPPIDSPPKRLTE
jgi:hypothetical protein